LYAWHLIARNRVSKAAPLGLVERIDILNVLRIKEAGVIFGLLTKLPNPLQKYFKTVGRVT